MILRFHSTPARNGSTHRCNPNHSDRNLRHSLFRIRRLGDHSSTMNKQMIYALELGMGANETPNANTPTNIKTFPIPIYLE